MTHRGPDDEGLFFDERDRVALGMRRLAVIDVAGGRQPVFSEDGAIACVFNGEIYNFQELRGELERLGHVFQSQTDTEVIVHLYEEEGVDCVRKLRGMFAFALWDGVRQRLVLARDRLGKKPLYFEERDGCLWFASEISALPPARRDVDPVALDLYLTHSYVPAPWSIYRGVRKLRAAEVLVAERGTIELSMYWTLRTAPEWDASADELGRAVRSKIEEAVRIRLISDVPLGCFLSGGVDSSAVVAIMSGLGSTPVRTFSIGFTDERFSELAHAREVAEQFRTDHHEFVVAPDAVSVLPDLARHFGEPYGDSSALPVWYVSKLARSHVTVALNGDGGDELFAGYSWYARAVALGRLTRWLPRWVGRAAARAAAGSTGRAGRLARRLAMGPAARFASARRFADADWRARFYSPDLLASCGDAADEYLERLYDEGDGDELSRMQYVDTMSYLPEDLLVKVDRMTMAHSLEGRSPLLDHELVELCARIPSSMKLRGGRSKVIFRDAVRDLFPPAFLERPKMGFSIPVAEWFRRDLGDEWSRKARPVLAASGWFDAGAIDALFAEHQRGARDWSIQLWNLLMLAEWAEVCAGSAELPRARSAS